MKKRIFCIVLCLVLLTGCSGESAVTSQIPRYTIGVLVKAMNSQHWLDMKAGVLDAAKAANVDTVILYPQDEGAAAEQQDMLVDLISAAPDAILYAPCDSKNTAALVQQAEEQGVFMMNLDTRSEDVTLPYVGADGEKIGYLAARQLLELVDGDGQIVVIAGVQSQSAHKDRVYGFEHEMSKHKGMHLVAIEHADSSFDLAMRKAELIIQQHPRVSGIFCTSAVMALGVIEYYKSKGIQRTPYIVAVDTQDDALNALQNGTLSGLISQSGYEAGYLALTSTVKHLDGAKIAQNQFIKTEMITRDTVDDFIKDRLRGMGGRQ